MQPTYNSPMGNPPDNNLVWAILCTVFCCLPLGIVSIVKSSKVGELWARGDMAGAQKAADDARKWAIWGAVIGPILIILFWILYAVIIAGVIMLDNGY